MQGNWKQLKGKVREEWGQLTDQDLEVIHGKRDQLIGKVQERYGVLREEAEERVGKWERRFEKAFETYTLPSTPRTTTPRPSKTFDALGNAPPATKGSPATSSTSDGAIEVGEPVGSPVADRLHDLRETGRTVYRRSRRGLQQVRSGLGDQVQAHPVTAVLVAGGVGLILGSLVSRRWA
jgi:uncharacterized protein YjbJ (UPF0337 family)